MYNQNDCYKVSNKIAQALDSSANTLHERQAALANILDAWPRAEAMLRSVDHVNLANALVVAIKKQPNSKQIGGSHYDMPIQPIEFITKNSLGYCAGNVIKYVSRYKNKNGIEDLKKAKHYLEILISMGGE